jgi:hypothetical protein
MSEDTLPSTQQGPPPIEDVLVEEPELLLLGKVVLPDTIYPPSDTTLTEEPLDDVDHYFEEK